MNQPVPTWISYLGKRSGLPQHCRVRSDCVGDGFLLYVGHPDASRWWRNFISPWPVTVIEPTRTVQGTGVALCAEGDEIVVRVRPSKTLAAAN